MKIKIEYQIGEELEADKMQKRIEVATNFEIPVELEHPEQESYESEGDDEDEM